MSDIIVPQSDVKLCTRNVNLYYGENHALKDINLDIKTNKITASIGPSISVLLAASNAHI